jgi:nucleoside-diphosphate-sugar epimerase
MTDALVGHTGFVGGNLAAQHRFDAFFNSKNIEDIAGRSFDMLVISGMPAAMWIANRDPEVDRAVLERLVECLRQVRAERVVVISTVAVYPIAVGVDEDSPIEVSAQSPYGRHRLMLEQSAADHFPYALVVRLPGLFGNGLKKNALHDLLFHNEVHKLNAGGVYQFYNLDWLWTDVSTALAAGLRLINFATEPVSIREVAREAYDLDFCNDPGTPPAQYDMRSKHAALFGGRDGYLYDRRRVLDNIRAFVQRVRAEGGSK